MAGAETVTHNYLWPKPVVHGSSATWGQTLNDDLDAIDLKMFEIDGRPNTPVSTTLPNMDGVATIGTPGTYATGDHIHPSDTTKLSIVGVANGAEAAPGTIGEYRTAANNVDTNIPNGGNVRVISLSLTPGDWDVQGVGSLSFSSSGGYISMTLSTTDGTGPDAAALATYQYAGTIFFIQPCTGTARVNVAVTTPVYLNFHASIDSGTCVATGSIRARRSR
jgi:hypothetical protein